MRSAFVTRVFSDCNVCPCIIIDYFLLLIDNIIILLYIVNMIIFQDQYPFQNEFFPWSPYEHLVPPTTFFGQGVQPDQFENYLNLGYPQEVFPDPNVPIMPQQYQDQLSSFMGAESQMFYPLENGAMFDQGGQYSPGYNVQDGLQQFNQYQFPSTQDMSYPQYPQPPFDDDFSWCYGRNEMYDFEQSKFESYNNKPIGRNWIQPLVPKCLSCTTLTL